MNVKGGREVVGDTETTGLEPDTDRIVEIALVEVMDFLPTGRTWHTYLNAGRESAPAAFAIHGLTQEFLSDKPKFAEVAKGLLEFIGDDPIVFHNAPFDVGFLNSELARVRMPPLRNKVVDTVELARSRFPGARVTLDDLCRRFGIKDVAKRLRHEALLDTNLLASVYMELNGGRNRTLELAEASSGRNRPPTGWVAVDRSYRAPRPYPGISPEETRLHAALVAKIKGPLWDAFDAGLLPESNSPGP